jgi:hypothetical protein
MITADKLALLTNMPTAMLTQALGKKANGYILAGSKFLGLTNGGQFCYSVVLKSKDFEGTDSGKVFLSYDPTADRVSATIG